MQAIMNPAVKMGATPFFNIFLKENSSPNENIKKITPN